MTLSRHEFKLNINIHQCMDKEMVMFKFTVLVNTKFSSGCVKNALFPFEFIKIVENYIVLFRL